MKKILSLCLCFILFGLGAVPVFAAADMTMTLKADKQMLKPGDQVTVSLDIQSEKSCSSFGMIMRYDEKVFKVVDGACELSGALLTDFTPDRGFAVFYWPSGKPNGRVGQVILQVRADAPAGEATFTGKTSVKTGNDSLECAINTLTFQITKEQTQNPEQSVQPTESEPIQSEQTTEVTEATQIQKETVPSASEYIPTIGQTAPIEEKGNDILLIAAIAVAAVAAMAVGGYFILKKKR